MGETIYCRKPVAREGGAWCPDHETMYVTLEKIREAREAA
jgi:hypothetical protein